MVGDIISNGISSSHLKSLPVTYVPSETQTCFPVSDIRKCYRCVFMCDPTPIYWQVLLSGAFQHVDEVVRVVHRGLWMSCGTALPLFRGGAPACQGVPRRRAAGETAGMGRAGWHPFAAFVMQPPWARIFFKVPSGIFCMKPCP